MAFRSINRFCLTDKNSEEQTFSVCSSPLEAVYEMFNPLEKAGLPRPGYPGWPMPPAESPCRSSHTRIHEKQDNCLVLIAPTARWILMRRTDAQSAAVPIKISYFNGRVGSNTSVPTISEWASAGSEALSSPPRSRRWSTLPPRPKRPCWPFPMQNPRTYHGRWD